MLTVRALDGTPSVWSVLEAVAGSFTFGPDDSATDITARAAAIPPPPARKDFALLPCPAGVAAAPAPRAAAAAPPPMINPRMLACIPGNGTMGISAPNNATGETTRRF